MLIFSGRWWKNFVARREQVRFRRRRSGALQPFSRLAAECQEARTLLSNIAVTTSAGVIALAGDAGDHSFTAAVVTISSVQNLELTGTGGTEFTFGSTTAATVDIPLSTIGTIKGLDITMQGGNDTVSFDGTNLGTISGNVTVNLGDGTNSLNFHDATVTGRMFVNSGSGTDAIDLSNDTLGALSIETGDGNDTVDLSTITINGVQPGGDTDDDGGDGEDGDGEHGGCEGRGWERGHGPFGDGPVFGNGPWDHPEHDEHTLGGSLTIRTGDGNDTIHLTSVTEASGEESSDPWSFCDHRWSFGQQWQIILGSGNDTVTFDSVQTNQSLRVIGGTGDDTVNVNDSTINGRANIALLSGDDQINVNTSTFDESARLSTGSGDGQTISVNDSTFQESAKLSVPGTDAQLNLETGGISGPGTTFEGPVRISLSGPSAVANFASAGPNNTLTFEEFVSVYGGNPAATVNIATANTTLDDNQLFLINANRNDV